jgi:hypothetical protein
VVYSFVSARAGYGIYSQARRCFDHGECLGIISLSLSIVAINFWK